MAFEPYVSRPEWDAAESLQRAQTFRDQLKSRRSLRFFSPKPIPEGVLQACLETAGCAPSGANQQPWHFAVVTSSEKKAAIREAAEKEERAFYHGRAPQEWLDALAPLGTDEHKPFLSEAPALVAIFAQVTGEEGRKHYYVQESVGIACGFLIAALHQCGLSCLTHTPSPMRFLNALLGRPANERPFLLLVIGYPSSDAEMPSLTKKALAQMASFH